MQEIRVLPRDTQGPTTVYCFEGIREEQADILRREVLTDPITQQSTLNVPSIEAVTRIGYKPGVMNPVEGTLRRVAQMYDFTPQAVATYKEYPPGIPVPQISQVEEVIVRIPETLLFKGTADPIKIIPITMLPSEALAALSITRILFLNAEEMQVIQQHYHILGREPSDIELETLAQTWSEHNGHKTFKARIIDAEGHEKPPWFTRIKETSQKFFERVGVVTAFRDNAGGIRFYDSYAIIGKGETHNSPVAIEPFGGAATKNGGVYRDIAGTGKGGVNLVGLVINNVAPPDTRPEDIPAGCLHPKHILLENSHGERAYGNPMGIPTHRIDLHMHPDFVAKPTSMGGVIGLIPEEECVKENPHPGDLLITIGGRTGRDGIHGATFSSAAMTAETQIVHATAVQLGNPIEEKPMFDALIEARDAGLIRTITDCGGGGYSSAIGELGEEAGVEVYLDQVPLKYQGLAPWEIWLSESQERMIVAIDPQHWEEFKRICQQYEISMDVIGRFTGDRRLTLKYEGEVVGQLSMEFLHHGLPQRTIRLKHQERPEYVEVPGMPTDIVSVWKRVLSHWNVCSTEEMLRQYDTTVQARTVLHPFGGVHQDAPNDASVIAPLYGNPYGAVTAGGSNPVLNSIDPYWGSVWAFTKAMSNFVAVGGNPDEAALIDNFVTPLPDEEIQADIDQMVDALCNMMNLVELPCVSGKDSLSSTYQYPDGRKLKIPPVLHMTVFGKIPDVAKTVTSDIKSPGSVLVLVGKQDSDAMGGSVYFDVHNVANSCLPHVDVDNLRQVLRGVHGAIQTGKVLSCHDIAEGGLATTLAEMCFGGDCGAVIDFGKLNAPRSDFALFNETAGCFVVEIASEEQTEELFGHVPHTVIGRTTAEKTLKVFDGETCVANADMYELKAEWQRPMKEVLS